MLENKEELVAQVNKLRDKGASVIDACRNVGITVSTYYVVNRKLNGVNAKHRPDKVQVEGPNATIKCAIYINDKLIRFCTFEEMRTFTDALLGAR